MSRELNTQEESLLRSISDICRLNRRIVGREDKTSSDLYALAENRLNMTDRVERFVALRRG